MTDGYQPFTLEVASEPASAEPTDSGIGADEQGAAEAAAPEPAPSAAPATDPRVPDLEAKVNQLLGAIGTLTGGRQSAAQQERITRELLNSPEATTEHLLKYFEQELTEREQRLLQSMDQVARGSASEQRWRGAFTADAMGGPNRTFDEVRSRYVSPVYESNPPVRALIQQIAAGGDNDPAIIEYGFGALMAMAEKFKNDPVKAYKALFDLMDGKADEGVVDRINRVAKTAANRIAGAGDATAQRGQQKYTPGMFRDATDDEFEKLDREMRGS